MSVVCGSTEKTKFMVVGKCDVTTTIAIQGKNTDKMDDFCYVGSVVSNNSSRDNEIRTRLVKDNSVFKRLNNIWKEKEFSTGTEVRLYNALVISTFSGESKAELSAQHRKAILCCAQATRSKN